MFDTN